MNKKTEYALMAKISEEKAVAPADVSAHELNGWHVVGVAEVDTDGKMTAVTGRVIETPAHVIETSDHFLKTMPKFVEPLPVVILPAEKNEPAPKK